MTSSTLLLHVQSGVSVFRVVDKEEEAASASVATDDPGTTRLVIPDDVISSKMLRSAVVMHLTHALLCCCRGALPMFLVCVQIRLLKIVLVPMLIMC